MSKSYKVFLLLLRIHSACQSLCSVIKVWNHHKNTIYVKLKKVLRRKTRIASIIEKNYGFMDQCA